MRLSSKRNPCDICVDPQCKGKQKCDCGSCSKKDTCYRMIGPKPTVRITRKCTQSCSHCCFECSPTATDMMSVEVANKVHKFIASNDIVMAEVMGGEFFLNPEWPTILEVIGEGLKLVRLVTSGDWAGKAKTAKKVIEFLTDHPQFYIGLSKDQWHTNKHVERASEMLKEAKVLFRVPKPEEVTEASLVPIGRNRFDFGFYSMMMAYCSPGERRYTFLIDETGNIFKCGLGAWPYDHIDAFQEGGFAARFKEFNTAFYYKAFVMSCGQCIRAQEFAKKQIKEEDNGGLGTSR